MMTPKLRLSTLIFACLCFKKLFLTKMLYLGSYYVLLFYTLSQFSPHPKPVTCVASVKYALRARALNPMFKDALSTLKTAPTSLHAYRMDTSQPTIRCH